MDRSQSSQGWPGYKWIICFLLLLATTLNYMDRQTLSISGAAIKRHFDLNDLEYGYFEWVFNIAFALGALFFGWLVDRSSLRWLYAIVVVGWSAAGLMTGFANSFVLLLLCRFALGLFEAGNWPCGIMTIKRVLKPEERTLGNGMFQSGTALGAIITPGIVGGCLYWVKNYSTIDPGQAWRVPFIAVGLTGGLWLALWLVVVRGRHVRAVAEVTQERVPGGYWALWTDRRFLLLIIVITSVNTTWRSFGFWLPLYLENTRHYDSFDTRWITTLFFIAADIGSMAVGFITIRLAKRGMDLHRARVLTFIACTGLSLLTLITPLVPNSWLLVCVLCSIGAGALGLFPTYFALSQEVSSRHQGKVTGTLGAINAVYLAFGALAIGAASKKLGSLEVPLALVGLAPVAGAVVLLLFWNRRPGAAKN